MSTPFVSFLLFKGLERVWTIWRNSWGKARRSTHRQLCSDDMSYYICRFFFKFEMKLQSNSRTSGVSLQNYIVDAEVKSLAEALEKSQVQTKFRKSSV